MVCKDLFSYKSGDFAKFENISFDDFKKVDNVILGHFTSDVFLEDILKNGILPPIKTNKFSNNDMFTAGDEEYVYLTSHFDRVFSKNCVKRHGGKRDTNFS